MVSVRASGVASVCGPALAALALIERFRTLPAQDLADMHRDLALSLSQGQLAIETFPALPLLLYRLSGRLLIVLDHASGLLPGAVIAWTLSEITQQTTESYRLLSVILACLGLSKSHQPRAEGAGSAFAVGESLVQGALLIVFFFGVRHLPRGASCTWLIAALLFAAALSSHSPGSVLSMLVAYASSASVQLSVRRQHSPSSMSNRQMKTILIVPLAALGAACMVVLVSTCVFPIGEVSSAGNYNLRHLSASARREMRFQASLSINGDRRDRKSPTVLSSAFVVHPGTVVSLYLPHAGFLWSDYAVWDAELAIFDTIDASAESEPRRVIFKDPVGRMKPWVIQRPVHAYSPSGNITPIQDGERILIRDAELDGFLTAESRLSILDRLFEGSDSANSRYEVGIQMTPGNGSFWKVLYDPSSDNGLRLYNLEHDCYLSSSLRSFPDWGGGSNDTIPSLLNLELESTCTEAPKDATSRFFVVDGWALPADERSRIPFHSQIKWTLRIYKAMWYLWSFRRQYPRWQDVPQYPALPLWDPAQARIAGAHSVLLSVLVALASTRILLQRFLRYPGDRQMATRVLASVLSFLGTRGFLRLAGWTEWASCPLDGILVGVGGISEAMELQRTLKFGRAGRQGF